MNIINTNFNYRKPLIPLNLGKVLFLVLHHTGSDYAKPEQIHDWHLNNGWHGFGYNEYIRKDGTIYIGRGDNVGSHCANMNSKSYGICVEGNYDNESNMPSVQYDALLERVKVNKDKFKNLLEIVPHNRFYGTSCPGTNFPLGRLLSDLENKETFEKSLEKLVSHGIMQSPNYWRIKATKDNWVSGDYARQLINKFASKLK